MRPLAGAEARKSRTVQRRTGDAEATAVSGGKATRSAMPLDRAIALIQWSWRRSRCVPQVAAVNEATDPLVGRSTNSGLIHGLSEPDTGQT